MKKILAIGVVIVAIIVIAVLISSNLRFAATPTSPHYKDLIKVESLFEGAVITSPLTVTGQARGTWYFEAVFPVVIVDWDGRIIAEGQAHPDADKEWMTEAYVPFTATIAFTKPANTGPQSVRGAVILRKDNPSGDPSKDAALEIPIVFK